MSKETERNGKVWNNTGTQTEEIDGESNEKGTKKYDQRKLQEEHEKWKPTKRLKWRKIEEVKLKQAKIEYEKIEKKRKLTEKKQ